MKNVDGYINRIQTSDGKVYALTCEPFENLKLNEIYTCLKTMDMMLYMHAHKSPAVVGFHNTEEMAEYYRQFLHVILPEEYRYNKEDNDTMAELVRR